MVREALTCPAAKSRRLFQMSYVERLLDAPSDYRTTLGASALWQLALLELWLQTHGI